MPPSHPVNTLFPAFLVLVRCITRKAVTVKDPQTYNLSFLSKEVLSPWGPQCFQSSIEVDSLNCLSNRLWTENCSFQVLPRWVSW